MDFPLHITDYDLGDEIGCGQFSKVYIAKIKDTGHICALKEVNLLNNNIEIDDLYKEAKVMKLCDHPKLLKLHCCFTNEDKIYFCFPKMMGNLSTKAKEGLCEEQIAKYLKDILEGLEYLHENDFVHRDIKGQNVFYDKDDNIVIGDFGITSHFAKCKTFTGTLCWIAPEILNNDYEYTSKADIWSLGITALELAKGEPPQIHDSPLKVMVDILNNEPHSLNSYEVKTRVKRTFSKKFNKFISKCLQKEPLQRYSASELLKDPFIKNNT